MKYWMRTLIGLALAVATIAVFNWALYELVRTGTCASGGPYVSARPCPEGTGLRIVALVVSIFAGFIAMGVYATRGRGGGGGTVGLGLLMWSLMFVLAGLSSLVAAFGPAAFDRADSKTGAVIVAAVFIPMGAAPLLFGLAGRSGLRRAVAAERAASGGSPPTRSRLIEKPQGPPTTWPGPAGDAPRDPAERLRKLAQLHEEGVLTDAEFAAQKAKILGEV